MEWYVNEVYDGVFWIVCEADGGEIAYKDYRNRIVEFKTKRSAEKYLEKLRINHD